MNDKAPMEFSTFVGPDSLREFTRLMKSFYDLHTKRYCGYEDINGSHYVGTIENFGAEQLIESRKILMDKPSLKNVFIENTFDFFFDIQYSGLVGTYDQQNMLSAVLRKDTLLSNATYRIRFDNVEWSNVPRSKSSSDPNVVKDRFIHTTTSPHLIVDTGEGVKEIELGVTDRIGVQTDYYFHIDHETIDMFDESELGNVSEIGTFTTNPITDNMYGREFVWMCVDTFDLLPDIGFVNNEFNGRKFLTLGTNGHDDVLVYPLINHDWNSVFPLNGRYLIKVIPTEDDAFVERDSSINFTSKVNEIQILYFGNDKRVDPGEEPDSIIKITYDQIYSKVTLFDFDLTKDPDFTTNIPHCGKWYFRKPREGDHDYDGRLYHNQCYAYTSLSSFLSNTADTTNLIPAFSVKFNDSFLHEYEGLNENACSGIHVDVTSDHSDNGVSKKNGVVHSMGDFDGLPKYFKYMIKDTIHRAHVEAYAIRDKLNDVNQLPNEKQTAGIIIDSAIPQNEIQKVSEDLKPVICFNMNDQININYKYDPDKDEGLSKTNYVSEICYIDEGHSGNSNIDGQKMYPKFIYHGNRHFSLGMMGFDPELEVGRVYIISNDRSSYENNETTDLKKPPVTFARICDIPTDFSQLVNIREVSPTLVIDPEYVRMFASFDTKDKAAVYNRTFQDKLIRLNGDIVVSGDMINAANEQFPRYIRLNESINLGDHDDVTFEIESGGSGYNVGDEFLFYIGGICVKGIVTAVDIGEVSAVAYKNYNNSGELIQTEYPFMDDTFVQVSNFDNRVQSYETKNVSGDGIGLTIIMTIAQSTWDGAMMITNKFLDDCFYLQKDYYDSIWAYTYDGEKFVCDSQITGIQMHSNIYDDTQHNASRTLLNAYLYDMSTPISNDTVTITTNVNSSIVLSNIPKEEDYLSDTDMSEMLNKDNINFQNGFFVIDLGYGTSNCHNIIRYENCYITSTQKDLQYPAYSDLSFSRYTNKTNKLRFHDDGDDIQPSLYLFDPTYTTIDETVGICHGLSYVKTSRPMLLTDILDTSNDIPANVIDNSGYLTRNIYISDEFDTSEHDAMLRKFDSYTREDLINYLSENYPDSYPFKFEGTDYEFSKDMLIDYIMKNILRWGRKAQYSDGDESIYRRPEIRLFRRKGDQIFDNAKRPMGDQPTGAFREITTDMFDRKVKVEKASKEADPLFVFRLDTDEDVSLNGFRLYDDLGNDISTMSLLIVNDKKYIGIEVEKIIEWVCLTKENEEEDEE